MEMIERKGVGRRDTDGHCTAHEEHTKILASLTANSRMLTVLVPLILSICSGIVAYYVNNMDKSMTKLSESVAQVQTAVNNVALTAAVTNQRLISHEQQLSMGRKER